MARVKEDFPESNPSTESVSKFEQPSFSPQQEKKFPFPLPVLIAKSGACRPLIPGHAVH